jgi:predicted unusual protein kinase regulating ubiquinone biosynthesis (AarF/ABC1/UbiB family)
LCAILQERSEEGLMGSSYRVTLASNDKTGDEGEKDRTLKACHKRCAERTLKVLEKNGSIFIKLGQHLVSTGSFEG